jgi:alpha-2-macroglobulin
MNEKAQPSRFYIGLGLIFAGLLVALAAGLWIFFTRGQTIPTIQQESGMTVTTAGEAGQPGSSLLRINLSAGEAAPDEFVGVRVVGGDPLTAAEVQRILARLPDLLVEEGDELDFNLREGTLPAPRPGETVTQPFPPPPTDVAPPDIPSGPLEVLRFAPEGEIPAAPFVSITFNQPMVALTTLEQLAEAVVPVRITPPLPGNWNWLGVQTLTFDYTGESDRLPMATEYRVEIPAGTTSLSGGVLAETVSWTFRTPPPRVQQFSPTGDSQPLEPIFFVSFDQAVEPTAVLNTTRLTGNGRTYALRLATADEIAADDSVSRLISQGRPERQFAFRAQEPLPKDTAFTLEIGPGTPSAEGPLVTEAAQSYSLRTYAPLRIQEHRCGWGGECPPLTPFNIYFNNALDTDNFAAEMVVIEPELPGAVVTVNYNTMTIQGMSKGRTTYRVTLDAGLTDVFGQTLGSRQSLTFRVGSAPSILTGPDRPFVTLDPLQPTLSVYSINYNRLNLRVYAVEPSDWAAYQLYQQERYRQDPPPPPVPGRELANRSLSISGEADSLTETTIDLNEFLNSGLGHLILVVEAPGGIFSGGRSWRNELLVWVQATQIGLDAFADPAQLLAWTTNLRDGSPLSGVNVTLLPGNGQATSGANGLAPISLAADKGDLLVARLGDDLAILPQSVYAWGGGGWQRQSQADELRWFVYDDRALYRPNEEVHVKGWLRRLEAGPRGDVALVGGSSSLSYTIYDSRYNQIGSGTAAVNSLGGFDFAFTLSDNMNLGYATIQLNAQGTAGGISGSSYSHNFQVQEFRRPEFEVTARNESAGPYFVDGQATVAVAANYYAGGPLPNAETTWRVYSTAGSYSPPNWPDFTFGYWTPWWRIYDYYYGELEREPQIEETFSGLTDAAGEHFLQLSFESLGDPRPFSVRAEATVMDVNRQAWTAATNLLVHPANLYVGLRSERAFVNRGTPLEIQAIVTDLDGNAISGRPIEMRAARMEWRMQGGRWDEIEADVQECTISSTNEPVSCTFATEQGGTYQISATVVDDLGRVNKSQFTRWVSGGQRPPARNVEQETVTLIPDKESYQPGDVAEILVQSPFSPAEGLLLVSRSGLLYSESFQLTGDGLTLRIPIEDAHIPNLNVQVELVGAAPRLSDDGEPLDNVPPRPAYASGSLNLSVPPLSRLLNVDATLGQTALSPGESTTLDVTVTDANGRAVPDAEFAVVVVDEAVLALTGYQMADPLAIFYQQRPSLISSSYSRGNIILVNPLALADEVREVAVQEVVAERAMGMATADMVMDDGAMPPMAAAPAMEMAEGEAAPGDDDTPIQIRSDFNPLATFAPETRTDANGRAQLTIQLPDNLTRYRVMVVAVADGRYFGTTESNLTARLPLMVRPSAPRFLNFGDQAEFPVVIQNQTNEPMTVDVAMQTSNLALTGASGVRLVVPAQDRVEVRFPTTTTRPGTARFQVAAVSGSYADAAQGEFPIYTPATTEAFATYGVIDSGAIAQPVQIPNNVFPQFGGLEITTSSTAVQALTDAVIYLVDYPFECSEQLASRILAIASLRDVLTAFAAEGLPEPAALEAAVQRDIDLLQRMQNGDGGYPIWRYGDESWPYYSIYAAHALHIAGQKGFAISLSNQQQSLRYLQNIESYYPHYYSEPTRISLSAYALHVRHLMGDNDPGKARNLVNQHGLDNMPLEAIGWLWPVLSDDSLANDIERHLNNRVVETAGAANFFTSYGDDAYFMLHSNRRTDAIILDSLIRLRPQSDLIPKVVTGLLAHRVNGRWGNTQENGFVLLALDNYFRTFEATTPDFVARIWLGDGYAGDYAFRGRTTERSQTNIPMWFLFESEGETQDLILSKEGDGRLYYRLGLRYAPTNLQLPPLDRGFVVQRRYEAVDDPDDVTQDENGVWQIRAGARVRVQLTMVATNRRYHVALVDYLPAGLEIINPDLAVSETLPRDPNERDGFFPWWWWGRWYQHQNLRDERAEAFTTLLWEGVYTYSYVARATTPGEFVAPPAKAEEMYSPEVFGRSATDRVIVR